MANVEDGHGGGYYLSVTISTPIYRTETICDRGMGIFGEGLDYATGNDISRGVIDASYCNPSGARRLLWPDSLRRA